MKISYRWLKDYLAFDLTPEQLSEALTAIGLETGSVEESETVRGGLKGLVIGKTLSCEKHPNSDHLHVTTVEWGSGPQQVVCGAPNVAAGQKVVVAPIGTTLYAGETPFVIKKSKIRGVESNGMICAEDEIGIGTGHEGIIVLPDNAPVGTPAATYYGLESDFVLEIDITPNRIDAASHYGVARDLAAYLLARGKNAALKKPSTDAFCVENPSPAITVRVENTVACPRYTGVTLKGVKVGESPQWLKSRLETVGVRSVNNVVDVTNYVLHETGQPLHAFDLGKIHGNRVVVQTLPEGTPFVTLDGVERKLSDHDLMICDEHNRGMCIGGVFGGEDSGVTENTCDVFLESACFNPAWIRKSARRHGLNTDASFRFERGTDPNHTLHALKRAALLIREVAGGIITGEVQDVYPQPVDPAEVNLCFSKMNRLIGKQIPEEIVETILLGLEIEIKEKQNDRWLLAIPTYRVDVTRDVDVIEEILRIYGYNQIEPGEELHATLSYQTPSDRSYELQNLVSEQLTGAGFCEILNNSLTSAAYYNHCSDSEAQCVALKNPLSADLNVMRRTLLFGGLESIVYNRNRKNPDLKFYEFGNTYSLLPNPAADGNPLANIREEYKLSLWLTGNSAAHSWIRPTEKTSVFELKAHVENILRRMGIALKKINYRPLADNYLQGAAVETVSGKALGVLGTVSQDVCKRFDIPVDVYFAELNWKLLLKENQSAKVKYSEISKFHPVRRDLALLVNPDVTFADIEKSAFQADKKILKEITLFDVYEGKNLPEGKKSYAVSFTLLDEEKTLTDKQIDALMTRIQKNLEKDLEAQLR